MTSGDFRPTDGLVGIHDELDLAELFLCNSNEDDFPPGCDKGESLWSALGYCAFRGSWLYLSPAPFRCFDLNWIECVLHLQVQSFIGLDRAHRCTSPPSVHTHSKLSPHFRLCLVEMKCKNLNASHCIHACFMLSMFGANRSNAFVASEACLVTLVSECSPWQWRQRDQRRERIESSWRRRRARLQEDVRQETELTVYGPVAEQVGAALSLAASAVFCKSFGEPQLFNHFRMKKKEKKHPRLL